MEPPIDWLLAGEPWVAYRTRLDLLAESGHSQAVQTARSAMLADPQLQQIIHELNTWPWPILSSHKSAGQPLHKLTFVADLGLRANDAGIQPVINNILARQSEEGPFQVPINIPTHFGGSGEDTWGWALCDSPLLVYALTRFGLGQDARVEKAAAALTGLVRENGWPCAVSKELGKFRGPGRKDDPCPYANLIMLKLLGQVPADRDGPAARAGAETLLTLWDNSQEQHPYIFYMGTDFRKLKVPLVWYDLVHVLDVLSQFPWLKGDVRLREMAGVLKAKMDDEGRFTPESIWTAWKDWEFGQKKAPSRWLTFLAWRILQRIDAF
ncbi:MAG: hypothetical protein CVU44_07825 [Chloroflexi bacterium HGW-Chloroflexi-6]|nr:MAG: hypothetical protein CVU44_07825 [Chloroflexi bacterium HGW-Chloroflexi-6]